jgi:ComF family protein
MHGDSKHNRSFLSFMHRQESYGCGAGTVAVQTARMKMKPVRAAIGGLSRILLPNHCVLCGAVLAEGCICMDCRAELPWTGFACERCGQATATLLAPGACCGECQQRPPPFDKAFAPLLYTFPVDSALKAMKFRRQLVYAPAFAGLLLEPLVRHFPDVDALLPVPLHPRRHALRGFNQAAELCRPLQRQTGLPVIAAARRIRFTQPQTGLDAAERRRNVQAAFAVRETLRCRHPLVIDDVITTGETCRQLAAALLRAGARRVSVLAVARASVSQRYRARAG